MERARRPLPRPVRRGYKHGPQTGGQGSGPGSAPRALCDLQPGGTCARLSALQSENLRGVCGFREITRETLSQRLMPVVLAVGR